MSILSLQLNCCAMVLCNVYELIMLNCNHRFDRTLGGHAMEMLMRDHLVKLFKVMYMYNTICCHYHINQSNNGNIRNR